MEQIGYLNDFLDSLNNRFTTRELKETTPEAKSYEDSCKLILTQLRELRKLNNPELLLDVEETMINDELKRYSDVPLMAASLEKAQREIVKAQGALKLLQNSDAYKTLKDGMSDKDIQKGLPLDAFRKFEKSHQVRLGNLLKSHLPHLDKRIIQQRKENLKVCREIYMGMQRQALGVDVGKDSGLEL